MNDAEMQGILDRFKFWENIKVYKDVTTGDLLKLLAAAKTKDAAVIRPVVVALAAKAGYAMDAKEINEVVDAVIKKDTAEIVYQVGDYAMKFSVQHLGYKPLVPQDINEPLIRMMAPVKTRKDAKVFLKTNRAEAIKGLDAIFVRRVVANHPEVARIVKGEMTSGEVAGLSDEQKAKIIDALRIVAKVATVVGVMYPPALILAQVLNLIIAFYDANHPVNGEEDVGLSLEDLAP